MDKAKNRRVVEFLKLLKHGLSDVRSDPLAWWVSLAVNRSWFTDIFLPFVLWGLIRALAFVMRIKLSWPAGEVYFNFVFGLLSFVTPRLVTRLAVKKHVDLVLRGIGAQPTLAGRAVMSRFMEDQLASTVKTIQALRLEGRDMDTFEIAQWVGRCFDTFRGDYYGIESTLPSTFMKLYAGYLNAHERYLKRTGKKSQRILLTTMSELIRDRTRDPQAYDEFMKWHTENGVELKLLDKQTALKFSREVKLPNQITDVAFWEGDASILFAPQGNRSKVMLRMTLADEELYKKCEAYKELAVGKAEVFTGELYTIPPKFAQKWALFVDPKAREAKTGDWLEQILTQLSSRKGLEKGHLRLMDCGAGLGIEVAYLLNRGFNVHLNEIDPTFRSLAISYIRNERATIPRAAIHAEDWLQFVEAFGKESYDALWILGNSLCLLPERDDVREALKQFYEVLAPGGVLIVDERNFDYIRKNWTKIEMDPWKNFKYSFKVMYCGHLVRGAPVQFVDDPNNPKIVFEYRSFETGTPELLARIQLLAFKKDELKNLLLEVGFSTLEIYSDLEERGYNPQADFFEYVAWK